MPDDDARVDNLSVRDYFTLEYLGLLLVDSSLARSTSVVC